jgi:hypothetical protein
MSRRSVVACVGLVALVVVGAAALEKAYAACVYECAYVSCADTGSQCLYFSPSQGYNIWSENPQHGTHQDCGVGGLVNWTEYEDCDPVCSAAQRPSDTFFCEGDPLDSGTTTKCVCTPD